MRFLAATNNEIASIKWLAKSAITQSVKVDETLLADIIEDTFRHIDGFMQYRSGVFLSCMRGDELLGFILIKDFWNLSDLYVLPAEHGNGIGRKLLMQTVKICQLQGDGRAIRCNSSLNAVGFYKRVGFVDFESEYAFPDYVVSLVLQI